MKFIAVALVCLLLAGVWLQDADSKSMHVSSSNCCFTFMKKKISQEKIRCYRNTSSTCPYGDRLILQLRGGRQSCALKTDRWVQEYLKSMKTCLL
ncbi:C-C motif chemokine 1 [Equus quagga]|uniref:C-C motif chemokine 1 n=2 Tax=Equus asinus TaxID=9793 RepID=A0A9L0IM80_EQUAS|nr:C-C motif chemokine 1 [Equus asinus]XP_046533769.1 C-C motif chemokine 1 [Equus quagga]